MSLTDAQLDRYARHIILKEIGGGGQKRLLDAHALIVGAGGIGSPVIQYLAAAGVGRLTVVDDDTVSRHVLVQALANAELPHLAVASGYEALEQIEKVQPSLVLLDLVMPPPDGYQILRLLRARPETRDLPVVVLTALEADEEIARAFEAGADDFVRKPFKPVELVARIRGQLRLRGMVEAGPRDVCQAVAGFCGAGDTSRPAAAALGGHKGKAASAVQGRDGRRISRRQSDSISTAGQLGHRKVDDGGRRPAVDLWISPG